MSSLASAITWIMNQVGYAICHQLPERTLTYGGRALPVCARCTGIFVGFAVCTLALVLANGVAPGHYPSWPKLVVFALFIIPTVVDALTSYAGLRDSTNAIRLITGALAGMGLAALAFPLAVTQLSVHLTVANKDGTPRDAADEEANTTFASWWNVALLLAVPITVSLALWPNWPGAYWVWAPLVTLSIIFTLLVLNFTLVSLAWSWARASGRAPGPAIIGLVTLLVLVTELIISNRMHWVFVRIA